MTARGPSRISPVAHALTWGDIMSDNQAAVDADAEQLEGDQKHGQGQPMHVSDSVRVKVIKQEGKDDE